MGVVVALLVASAGAFYAFSQQRSWVAESMVVVLPSADLDEATSASYYETLSRGQIVATFAEVASTQRFEQQAEDQLGLSPAERSAVSTEVLVVPDTAVILIRSTAGDAETAQQISRITTSLSVAYLDGLTQPFRAVVVPSGSTAEPTGMSPWVLAAAGADGRAGGRPGRAAGRLPPLGRRSWPADRTAAHEPRACRRAVFDRLRPPDLGRGRRDGGGATERSGRPVTTTLGRPRRHDPPEDQRALRIVLVEFLPSGGMFQFSFQFAAALARAGHTVTLLTGPDPELTSRVEGLQVESVLPTWHPNADAGHGRWGALRRVGRALRLLESWRRVLGQLRRERPDVAQFGELRFLLDSAALAVVARLVRPTTVVDVAHNPLPYNVHDADQSVEKTGRLTRALLGRAYAACGVVLVLGEGPERQLRQHFPALPRVAVCGHGDYAGVLESAEVPRPSAAPPAALFFGAWTTYKNIPLLLDAFAIVRATRPEARLTLAGPVMPDIDLAALRTRAAEIGGIDLRPGYVPMEDLAALFGAHRVVMFTYETVNISGSIHMAYTFGRPVVATDVGAMADNVQHGQTGLLVDPDPAAVAGGDDHLARPGGGRRDGSGGRPPRGPGRLVVRCGREGRGGVPLGAGRPDLS